MDRAPCQLRHSKLDHPPGRKHQLPHYNFDSVVMQLTAQLGQKYDSRIGFSFSEARSCCRIVRINASKQTPHYQQLHVANAVEPLSLGNPARQKPHRCDEEKLSKEWEIFPDPGAQWSIDAYAFERQTICWAVWQTYSKSILKLLSAVFFLNVVALPRKAGLGQPLAVPQSPSSCNGGLNASSCW